MANCKIHTDLDTGQISVEAPNGQPSKLYMDALEITNNQEQALEIWSVSETDNFKELIASQYENNRQTQEIEQTGVGVSEIHQRLASFVGGYERAIRTHDAENERGQNRERIKRESVALIDYAKESGIFISNINETFEPTELSGAESDIYLKPNNPNVIIKEFVPYSHNGYQGALGRILLQNRLFPQTAYDVIGVTQYGDYAALVLEQPFVKNARNATVEEIFQYVEDIGFEITSSNAGVYTAENQDGVILSDLHEGNLLVAPDGSMHLIDPQISYEGTTPFYQYTATLQPTSQVTTDENGEVDLSLVMTYIQANNAQTVEPMTPTEEQTVKNMLLSFDIPNSDYLNQRLQRLFPNGVFSLDSLRTSTLFSKSEKKYISESTEAQNNLLRLSQQLNNRENVIVNDLFENQDRNFVVYSGNKNKYGVDEVKNPAQVEQEIIDTVGGIRNREEFDSAFNSLPYESIIEEYNSNEETANAYFERYSTMHRTPVQRIENNEVVRKNDTDRATTVENTATLEKVDFRDDIRFLSQVPNDVWEDSEQEVVEALESIEAKGVTSAIDLQGLAESYSFKTQQEIIGFLATLNNLQNNPTEATLDNFIQSYREFFEVEATPSTEVQEVSEENASKTIYKVENPTTEYDMFNDHSMVKIDGNNYQKVQKQPLETMYEALYAQITRGQSRLPKKAYGDSNNKTTMLGNIRNFINGLLGGITKIPNRVVEKVNPKTQARLIAEYLKEKLGYDIKILPENTLQEEVENRQQEVLQSSRVQEEGIIRRSDLTQVADQTVQDILEYNQYYKSKQLVEQGTKRSKPKEFVENSRFNTESAPVLVLGYPSEILTGSGVPNLPIEVTYRHFQEHIIEELHKPEGERTHNLNAKDISQIMRGMHNPLAVYKNIEEGVTRTNRVEVLTPLKNRDGEHIIIIIEKNKTLRTYDKVFQRPTDRFVNQITTGFATISPDRLRNAINRNELLFLNKKRLEDSYLGGSRTSVVNRKESTNLEEGSYLGGSTPSPVVDRNDPSNLSTKIQQILESTRNFQNFNNINEVVFLKDKNETIYGFHDPQTNEIYLTEEYLSSESLIHEMSHAYFPVIRQQAAQGNKQAQLVLDKMEAAAIGMLGEDYIKDRYERRKQDNNINFSAESNYLTDTDFNSDGTVKQSVLDEISAERENIEQQAKANGTWLKAPNGKNSNLTPEQWVTVRTKRFKNWFGDWMGDPEEASKVVDENGEPKIMYHGSAAEIEFEEFNTDNTFITDNDYIAESYMENMGGEVTYKMFANIKNPFVLTFNNIKSTLKSAGYSEDVVERATESNYFALGTGNILAEDGFKKLIDYAKNKAKDGLQFRDPSFDNLILSDFTFLTFNNNQIKSASGNAGTFSEGTNNINFSVAQGNRLFNTPLEEASSMVEEYFRDILKTTEDVFDGVPSVNENRAKVIADLFDNMEENNDPKTIEAYEKMIEETISQFEFIISKGYAIEVNNSEPYSNSGEMIKDLRENKNMKIFSTESGFGETPITEEQRERNPLLQKTQFKDKNGEPLLANDLFRFVHDFFGHSVLGNGFGPIGEENAWNVHARMYTPLARRAMTTETRGQNSWVNFSGANTEVFKKRDRARKLRRQGRTEEANRITNEVYEELKFADQKIGLLPEWVSDPYAEVAFGTQPFKELTPKQQAMMLGYNLDEKGSKIVDSSGKFKYGKGEIVSINDVVDKSLMSPQEKRLLESSGIKNIRMYGGRGSSEGILFYNRDTKEVHVNINNSLGGIVLTSQDNTNRFVLHELIHHIINDQVTDEASFNEELSKLRKSLSNNKERASDYVKHIIGHMEAGSPEEVLTYMLTDKKVAEFMATIPYDSKQPNKGSLWTQLIEFLTGVLKGNSLADEAVNILNNYTDSFWNNESQESKYKSIESFETTLKEGVWGMLTAENPNADGRAFTKEQNIQANERAKKWLIDKNYNPSEIQGMYGGNVENSFLVEGLTRQDALEFIREFNQESVATNEGYVYQDGTMNPINKDNIEIQGAFEDNYSTININGVNVSYKVDYDFSTTQSLNFKITGEENINDILSSAFAYDPRQGESFEEYRARMIDEAMAVIMQENSVEYFERIAEENGLSEQQTKTFLQEIKEFIKQFSKWLSAQFGIDTVSEDMSNKELYDAVTTSMLRGDLITTSPTLKEVTGGNVSFSVKEDSYDMDVAENLLLTKLYFKNPINPTPAENNLEVDRPFIESFDGDYNYLSSDYISDFQTETLRQRNNGSTLYNEVYSQLAIGESGIVPINTDNFSLENLKAAIEEYFTEKQYNDLRNYSVISKNRDIKQLFEVDPQQPTIETMSQERVYYQNNLETLPHFTGDYQTINENSITTSEAGQNFIRINNNLYEKAQDAASQSFYRKIPTYNEVFNVITERQPIDKFGYEEINPYIRTTETIQTESNKYSREELNNINEEYFSCKN